jgi:6-pyruvoyltetrahydropterin/6-carboxytetrahydropterin synthase
MCFEVEKIFSFEAGHLLDHHDGKCRHPHGHSYVLKIRLRSEELVREGPKKNMVIDFSLISSLVKPMIETYFDHKWLNTTLECDSPTAEYIAYWVFHHLEPLIPNLYSVTVCETPSASATYTPRSMPRTN